ncbi:Ig-like domain-containing protein [Anaerocolumna xylanovorans]|uniref:Ig-like domain (Group 2) n=1 Tax=Anaerocolumna xylanovorans DSM 12503 TaxID=1121345 RepID=A0A1M7YLX8_9FIRM|nr:Ig-like domain-containing protein [Anaerocolumna xylanovorans]SHO53610.1 Ig-like domain (group 2) [Anaerocolumna xylanovorans DSM 12503]
MKSKFFRLFRFQGPVSIIYYIAFVGLLWYLVIPHTSIYYRTNLFDPFSEKMNAEDVVLKKGEEFHLYLIRLNQRVTYSSTDIKVADVSIFGTVTAYRPGTTFIRIRFDGRERKCRVRVIDISHKKLTLSRGNSCRLYIKGPNGRVKWYSGNKKIATVSRFGKVKAKKKGWVVIYAKVEGKLLTCRVAVR